MAKKLAGNLFFEHFDFDLQLLRSLGHIYDNGADFGECMSTAFAIEDGNFASWHAGWKKTAERIESIAQQSFEKGHIVSARRTYLRAAEYYRQAEFFLREDLKNPECLALAKKLRRCFQAAVNTIYPTVQVVSISHEQIAMPGYFFPAVTGAEMAPTLIYISGYDSYAEEGYFQGGRAALARGYNVLLFDGPGQGLLLREQGIYFSQNWASVIGSVLDFIPTLPHINMKQVVLMGRNLAGFHAIKAAVSHSDRLGAVVLDPGQYDVELILRKQLSEALRTLFDAGKKDQFNAEIEARFAGDSHLRFFIKSRLAAHNLNSPFDYFNRLKSYKVTAKEIAQITCPTAICVSGDDFIGTEQSIFVRDHLACDKTYIEFSTNDGAGDTSEVGAAALFYLRIFDWLDEVFAIKRVETLPVKD